MLEGFFESQDSEFNSLRAKARSILQEEESLSEIVQLVGKDSLGEDQKVVLEMAKILREDFLQQNAFSDYDYNCPLHKSIWMLRTIIHFHDLAYKAVSAKSDDDDRVTWAFLKTNLAQLIYRITSMKFEDPEKTREGIEPFFTELNRDIDHAFQAILED